MMSSNCKPIYETKFTFNCLEWNRRNSAVICTVLFMGILFPWINAWGEDDPVSLPELNVTGRAESASGISDSLPGLSSTEAAAWIPGISLRQQGSGAQSDLRLRGSSFSETGYTIAGSTLRNPQTEHFNSELPIPAAVFQPLRIATGIDQAAWGSGHAVGSIVTDFAPIVSGGNAGFSAGEQGTHGTHFHWRQRIDCKDDCGPWGIGLFASRDYRGGLDHHANDIRTEQGGAQIQYLDSQTQADLVGAYQKKAFGAVGFYGSPATRLSSEEIRDILVLGSWKRFLDDDGEFLRVSGSWRHFHDLYTLDDLDPEFYRNTHTTRTTTTAMDGRWNLPLSLALTWRLYAEDERINSEGIYLHTPTDGLGRHNRQRYGFTLLPEWSEGRWQIRCGATIVDFSNSSPEILFLFGTVIDLNDRHSARLDYTESIRQPSFTELDYQSPTSLGNRGLENEKSSEWSAALTSRWFPGFTTTCSAFRRHSNHAVDWIRLTPGGRWLATDMADVDVDGARIEGIWNPGTSWRIETAYQYLHKETLTDYHASRYLLDYPEHDMELRLVWKLTRNWQFNLAQSFLRQKNNPARNGDRTGLLSQAGIIYTPSKPAGFRVGVTVDNLWNDSFEVFPGQESPSRFFSGHIAYMW